MITSNAEHRPVIAIANDDPLLDIAAVCGQLGVSERSLYRALAAKKFPPPASLPGKNRWFQSDVNTYLRQAKARR